MTREPEDRLTKVSVGERFTQPRRGNIAEVERTVAPACEDKNGGYWWCVTHGVGFQNQFQKDSHIGWEHGDPPHAKHRLAWICFKHGPEVP